MSSFLDPLNLAPNTLTQPILSGWSMFTVNEGNSSAPATEQRVVAQASYGRQIGRMMDVVEVLLTEADRSGWSAEAAKAVKDFETLKASIDDIKRKAQEDRQARLIEDLQALRRRDRAQFDAVIQAVTISS
ncbi:MAG: hypothetical protein ACXU8U_03900 [Asticcacaulis sp.]